MKDPFIWNTYELVLLLVRIDGSETLHEMASGIEQLVRCPSQEVGRNMMFFEELEILGGDVGESPVHESGVVFQVERQQGRVGHLAHKFGSELSQSQMSP